MSDSNNAMMYYDAARNALQTATQIDEVKDLSDKAKALELYAHQHKSPELENYAAKIKARAARRLGELSRELKKAESHGGKIWLPDDGKSKAATLKAAGISTSAANRFEAIADLPEDEFEGIIDTKTAQNKPVKITEIEAAALSRRREARSRQQLQTSPPALPEGLYQGDFRDFADTIPDDSVELIFTDPPYDRESIPLFGDLARVAARVLKPGGSVVAYCGQIQLPDVLNLMSEHLRYWWVNACIHSERSNQMRRYGIKNDWKPMVWYVKGTRGDVQTFVSDAVSGRREKSHHEWQQAQGEAEYYIEHLCSASGVVWDPFAGGGTTLAAANRIGRRWIACEQDILCCARIGERITT